LAPEVPRAARLALREGAVDALGARIESECFSILARHPHTSRQERRLLGTIIRIATALERIGDAGTLMLERSAELSSAVQPCGASTVVQEMAANVLDMLSRAVVAFNTRNGELAATVRAGRPVVTGLGERLVHDSLRAVREGGNPPMSSAMRFVVIADHLEQIAGHAVAIAERVVSLVEGPPRDCCPTG
jgi:phosphate uptake regulator